MTLDEIVVYPVKGAGGTSATEARVDDFGLHLDRRWMLVDGDGVFLSQRNHPRLALLRPRIRDGSLVLDAPGMDPFALPVELPLEVEGAVRDVQVWDATVEAVEVEGGADEWIEAFLGEPAHLVFMPESTLRPVGGDYAPDARVSFADGFPFLLLSRESLEELNRRLDRSVPMNRFRPNLVVKGAGPHAEDAWRRIRIGDVELDVVKPCGRCAVTTVDQDSGRRGAEPLRTLSRYRKHDGKTWFGQYIVQKGTGTLEVGDPVQVLESGTPRPRLDLHEADAPILQSRVDRSNT